MRKGPSGKGSVDSWLPVQKRGIRSRRHTLDDKEVTLNAERIGAHYHHENRVRSVCNEMQREVAGEIVREAEAETENAAVHQVYSLLLSQGSQPTRGSTGEWGPVLFSQME